MRKEPKDAGRWQLATKRLLSSTRCLLPAVLLLAAACSLPPVGLFQRPDCTTIPNPVVGKTYCLDETIRALRWWNGANWIIMSEAADVIPVESYPSFAAAVTVIGSSVKTLRITSSQAVTSDVTVPPSLTLSFVGSGKLSIASGVTVTLNSAPVAPDDQQIFAWSGTGRVVFGSAVSVRAPLRWWGAKCDNSTDDTAAITAAVTAVPDYAELVVPLGVCKSSTSVVLAGKPLTIRGYGWRMNANHPFGNAVWNDASAITGSVIRFTAATHGIDLQRNATAYTRAIIRDLALWGPNTGVTTGLRVNLGGTGGGEYIQNIIENVAIAAFYETLSVGALYYSTIRDNHFRGMHTGIICGSIGPIDTAFQNQFLNNRLENFHIGIQFEKCNGNTFSSGLLQFWDANAKLLHFKGAAANNVFDGIWIEGTTGPVQVIVADAGGDFQYNSFLGGFQMNGLPATATIDINDGHFWLFQNFRFQSGGNFTVGASVTRSVLLNVDVVGGAVVNNSPSSIIEQANSITSTFDLLGLGLYLDKTMQSVNNVGLQWKDSGGTPRWGIYLDNANYLRLGDSGVNGIRLANPLLSVGTTFGALGVPDNGTIIYCSDCTIANPCAGGGTGAIAKRLNNIWVCN